MTHQDYDTLDQINHMVSKVDLGLTRIGWKIQTNISWNWYVWFHEFFPEDITHQDYDTLDQINHMVSMVDLGLTQIGWKTYNLTNVW